MSLELSTKHVFNDTCVEPVSQNFTPAFNESTRVSMSNYEFHICKFEFELLLTVSTGIRFL